MTSNRTASVAATLRSLRARAAARGERDRWEEERAARLVAQGILSEAEALDALALLLVEREGLSDSDADLVAAQRLARTAYGRARAEEDSLRHRLGWAFRREVGRLLAQRASARAIMDRLLALNIAEGRPFVWPELRRIADREAAAFLQRQEAQADQW